MDKCGFITGGVFATISGGLGVALSLGTTSISFLGAATLCSDDEPVVTTDDFYNWNNNNDYDGLEDAGCVVSILFVVYGVASGLWLVAAILFFVFACCGAHDKIAQELQAQNREAKQALQVVHISTQPIAHPNAAGQVQTIEAPKTDAQPAEAPLVAAKV